MKEIIRLCAVLTVIAAVSAGVLAFVSEQTEEPIRNALREETLSAVRSVLPPFDNQPDEDTVVLDVGGVETAFYRGRKDGAVVGAAFPVVSMEGYSGEIAVMVGVDTLGVVRGIEVLRHLETPGLGAKITTEAFRAQYAGKSLAEPAEWAVTKDGGTFTPITGATISSRAVTKAIAAGLRFFADHRDEILGAAAEPAGEVEQ